MAETETGAEAAFHTGTGSGPGNLGLRGGGFLLTSPDAAAVTLPEDRTPEDRAIAETVRAFVGQRVAPVLEDLERTHDRATLRHLMSEAGALGLLGVEVPEAYGGMGLPRVTGVAVLEAFAPAGGVAVAQAAHSGLATLPLAWFGTEDQRRRYLARLASGEWVGAYALTEPGYGSDALHARTTARRDAGGGFVLNGEKQWITNAGIADLFTVFAQLEGEGFTAFLVEQDTPGVSTGPEYNKMGIRSSSTRPLILEDVRLGPDQILGEPGKGHRIALGVLDVSRLNLGAGTAGAARRLVNVALDFAEKRVQFGEAIANFGLIQEKLARMQAHTWALEAAVYRTAGLIDRAQALGIFPDPVRAASEYAVECAVVKVLGSEVLDLVADDAVQIHGGYGYMQDYEVERAYRDARIHRIFEGTNEINRLTIPEVLLRRSRRGELPLEEAARAAGRAGRTLERPSLFATPMDTLVWRLSAAKTAFLATSGLALSRLGDHLAQEEELLAQSADVAMAIYHAESAALRALRREGDTSAEDMALLVAEDALGLAYRRTVTSLVHLAQGDERRLLLSMADRLFRTEPLDRVVLSRRITQALRARGSGLADSADLL